MSRSIAIALATGGLAVLCAAAPVAAQAPTGRISGTVTGPAGADMSGLFVYACPAPFDDCDRASIKTPVVVNGGLYMLRGLKPGVKYQVLAWKDADGNNDPSDGDLLRAANNGEPVLPGSGAQNITVGVFHGGKIYARLDQVPGRGAGKPAGGGGSGGGGGAGAGAMAGSWGQASNSSELVLTPKVRVMPGIAPGSGFSVGSMGTGASQVTTTIQNEYSSIPVSRRMTLDVQPNGAFKWVITKSRAASAKGGACRINTREEKNGRVELGGGRVTFTIIGGTSSSEDTCNPSKRSSSAKGSSSESYNYSVSGSTMRISGSGGVNWVFNRR